MIDVTSSKPLRVSTIGTVGPHLRLPFSQVPELRLLLDQNNVRYRVQDNVISLNGGPAFATVSFGREGDAAVIQAILDRWENS